MSRSMPNVQRGNQGINRPQRQENMLPQRRQENMLPQRRQENRLPQQNLREQIREGGNIRENRPPQQNLREQIKSREPGNLREQIQNRTPQERERIDQWKERGAEARNRIQERHPDWHHWFDNDFWHGHHHYPHYPYHWNYWRPIAWGTVTAWLPWSFGSTYYYFDNGYYYSSQAPEIQIEAAPLDYEQTEEKIASAPQGSSSESDWMPLGVYALTSTGKIPYTPNMYLQLALNKEGAIEGTLYNSASDELFPISGYVEKETEKVLMQVSGNENSPILETGLYNLTQDQASIQLHFANGLNQNWLLVRLKS
jgi:hypothetical protein